MHVYRYINFLLCERAFDSVPGAALLFAHRAQHELLTRTLSGNAGLARWRRNSEPSFRGDYIRIDFAETHPGIYNDAGLCRH